MTDWKQLLTDIALRLEDSKYLTTAELSQYGLRLKVSRGALYNEALISWAELESAKWPIARDTLTRLESELEFLK